MHRMCKSRRKHVKIRYVLKLIGLRSKYGCYKELCRNKNNNAF